MSEFIGEYGCRLDAKGRFMLPVGLRKQLSPEARDSFVANRGFEQHLTLYPMDEWQKITAQLKQLNLFVAKNRKFYRQFHNGASVLPLDTTGRLLIPKTLMGYAGIAQDITLFAYANRIEIWATDIYQEFMKDTADFADLAEEVMGSLLQSGDSDVS